MSEEQKPTPQFKNPAQKGDRLPPQLKKPAPQTTQPAPQFKKAIPLPLQQNGAVEWAISPIPQVKRPVNSPHPPSGMPSYDYTHLPTINMPTTPPPATPPLAVSPSFPPETSRSIFVDPQVEQYYLWLQQNNAVAVPDAVMQTYENAALEVKQIGSQLGRQSGLEAEP